MDSKWRYIYCGICQAGEYWVDSLYGPYSITCPYCHGWHKIYLRPSGHAFAYPGGPAIGRYSSVEYEAGYIDPVPWDGKSC